MNWKTLHKFPQLCSVKELTSQTVNGLLKGLWVDQRWVHKVNVFLKQDSEKTKHVWMPCVIPALTMDPFSLPSPHPHNPPPPEYLMGCCGGGQAVGGASNHKG